MAYQPTPTKTEGGQLKAVTADEVTQQLLELILAELQQVNVQLALMNDTALDTGDSL